MMCQNAKLVSSTLKDIPNKFVREAFSDPKFEGLDGEGCVGSLTDGNCFSRSTSLLMSDENPVIEKVIWNIFDKFVPVLDYEGRAMKAINQIDSIGSVLYVEIKVAPNIYIKWVDQVIISNLEEFLSYERKCIDEGYEGALS